MCVVGNSITWEVYKSKSVLSYLNVELIWSSLECLEDLVEGLEKLR